MTVTLQNLGGPINRSIQHTSGTVIQRMGTVHRWLQPGEPLGHQVQFGQER